MVLLDDPTGDCADPATRRATWAMLRARARTTVVLVTRSVAEASAVADRIAVMSHGRVKCCGGLTFLRKLYGLGYRLHVTLADGDGDEDGDGDADGDDDGDGDADAHADTLARDRTLALLDAVRRRVPEAEIARDPSSKDSAFRVSRDASTSSISSRSVVVSLADHAGRIGALLADLESNADRLGVRDVALEATSLEEALPRLGEESTRERGESVPDRGGGDDDDDTLDVGLLRADERDVGASASAFDTWHAGERSSFGLDASDGRNGARVLHLGQRRETTGIVRGAPPHPRGRRPRALRLAGGVVRAFVRRLGIVPRARDVASSSRGVGERRRRAMRGFPIRGLRRRRVRSRRRRRGGSRDVHRRRGRRRDRG